MHVCVCVRACMCERDSTGKQIFIKIVGTLLVKKSSQEQAVNNCFRGAKEQVDHPSDQKE